MIAHDVLIAEVLALLLVFVSRLSLNHSRRLMLVRFRVQACPTHLHLSLLSLRDESVMCLSTAHTKLIKGLCLIHSRLMMGKLHLNIWQFRLVNHALIYVGRFLPGATIIVNSRLPEIYLWTAIVHRSTTATHLTKAGSNTRRD